MSSYLVELTIDARSADPLKTERLQITFDDLVSDRSSVADAVRYVAQRAPELIESRLSTSA